MRAVGLCMRRGNHFEAANIELSKWSELEGAGPRTEGTACMHMRRTGGVPVATPRPDPQPGHPRSLALLKGHAQPNSQLESRPSGGEDSRRRPRGGRVSSWRWCAPTRQSW